MSLLISVLAAILSLALAVFWPNIFIIFRVNRARSAFSKAAFGSDRSRAFHLAMLGIFAERNTPYIAIDTSCEGVVVPLELKTSNPLVLNISPSAIIDVKYCEDTLYFKAKFSGFAHKVRVPIKSVKAVYALETNIGLRFDEEDGAAPLMSV